MISVKDEILSGEPLYRLIDNNGNLVYDNVKIELKTPVKQAGTPLNKVLFDSISTDLTNLSNNKLNASSKATTVEAETGTDDTKYMTPLKTAQVLKEALKVKVIDFNITEVNTYTINLDNYATDNSIYIEIEYYVDYVGSGKNIRWYFKGIEDEEHRDATQIIIDSSDSTVTTTKETARDSIKLNTDSSREKAKIIIDKKSKSAFCKNNGVEFIRFIDYSDNVFGYLEIGVGSSSNSDESKNFLQIRVYNVV